jgi:hypothetical protein
LLLLLQLVAADVKQLSASVLGQQPVWVQNRSADIVLDFRKADPHYRHPSPGTVQIRGKDMKVNFHIGYYHGNVAMVRYGTSFILAVRKMHFYKTMRSAIENYPLSTKKGTQAVDGVRMGQQHTELAVSEQLRCIAGSMRLLNRAMQARWPTGQHVC